MAADLPRLTRAPALDNVPERAVQFGTGAFLRAFVDAYLDEASARGTFDGRVVAIGSTGSERDQRLREQEGLFTLITQGLEDGMPRRSTAVVSSVSRAVSASDDWPAVLDCARNPSLDLVF